MAAGLVGGLARLPSDSAQLAEGLALEVHQLDRLSEHLAEGGDGCLELLGGSVLLSTARPCLADGPRRAPGGDGGEKEGAVGCGRVCVTCPTATSSWSAFRLTVKGIS